MARPVHLDSHAAAVGCVDDNVEAVAKRGAHLFLDEQPKAGECRRNVPLHARGRDWPRAEGGTAALAHLVREGRPASAVLVEPQLPLVELAELPCRLRSPELQL